MLRIRIIVVGVFMLFASVCAAAKLDFQVLDGRGRPLQNAVVSLTPFNPNNLAPARLQMGHMRQSEREFLPYVLPVQINTPVFFPNEDPFQHHVYSFSPPKRFELKLFSGINKSPVVFDKRGIVTVGCNIHDWMIGYIVVLNTPYFAKSEQDGGAHFAHLPPGAYAAEIWHPQIAQAVKRTIHVTHATAQAQSVSLWLSKPPKPSAPEPNDDDFEY